MKIDATLRVAYTGTTRQARMTGQLQHDIIH
jgi:hypothetical protein